MGWVGQKGGLVSFDQMPKPSQCERRRNQQQTQDPVKPDYDQRREPDRNRDHMEGTIHRMIMRTVIVRVETHTRSENLPDLIIA